MAKLNIVWAFDPYSDINDTWQASLGIIDNLKENNDVTIHSYYILGQEMVHWVSNVTPPKLELIHPKVQEAMNKRIASFNRDDFAEPKVLISEGFSTRDDIEYFYKELRNLNPDLVVMNTHQRSGVSRMFMGSFTENFLLKCQFPTLVIPPNLKFSQKITKTVIPSSLNEKEKSFFDDFVNGSMGFKTDLVIYSKVFHPIDAFATSAATALGGAWVSLETYSQEAVLERMKKGEKWGEEASAEGVNVTVKVDDSPKDFAESLLEVAKQENVQMIALPSFTGKAEAVLLGSNAREVIRQSEVPVLVRHYSNT